jgi:hypothetical protein
MIAQRQTTFALDGVHLDNRHRSIYTISPSLKVANHA